MLSMLPLLVVEALLLAARAAAAACSVAWPEVPTEELRPKLLPKRLVLSSPVIAGLIECACHGHAYHVQLISSNAASQETEM